MTAHLNNITQNTDRLPPPPSRLLGREREQRERRKHKNLFPCRTHLSWGRKRGKKKGRKKRRTKKGVEIVKEEVVKNISTCRTREVFKQKGNENGKKEILHEVLEYEDEKRN